MKDITHNKWKYFYSVSQTSLSHAQIHKPKKVHTLQFLAFVNNKKIK